MGGPVRLHLTHLSVSWAGKSLTQGDSDKHHEYLQELEVLPDYPLEHSVERVEVVRRRRALWFPSPRPGTGQNLGAGRATVSKQQSQRERQRSQAAEKQSES